MKKEIWKPVLGYVGLYEASNYGRVRSLDRWVKYSNGKLRLHKGRILKPGKTKGGYLHVCLCIGGKNKRFFVHRLVYEAFNGTIPNGMEINHIDENTGNNSLSNLSAVSHKDNINWGTRTQKVTEKRSDPVLQLTLDDVLVKEWPSMSEAERQTGISHANISNCCNGKRKQANGFKWMKILPSC